MLADQNPKFHMVHHEERCSYDKIMNDGKQHSKFELVFLVDCDMDAEMACGEGAANCTIQANNNVQCECDTGYHPSDNLHSCVIGMCVKICKAVL